MASQKKWHTAPGVVANNLGRSLGIWRRRRRGGMEEQARRKGSTSREGGRGEGEGALAQNDAHCTVNIVFPK